MSNTNVKHFQTDAALQRQRDSLSIGELMYFSGQPCTFL